MPRHPDVCIQGEYVAHIYVYWTDEDMMILRTEIIDLI